MNIVIQPEALQSEDRSLLPGGALTAMAYLQHHGIKLMIDLSRLSDKQQKLLQNEGVVSAAFNEDAASGTINKKEKLQFLVQDTAAAEADDWRELARKILFPSRKAEVKRSTKETDLTVAINLDGTGISDVQTGLSFFDHMLDQIARHGMVDLTIRCDGDLDVDEHHTIEDTAIALGQAIHNALSADKAGIQRYGFVLPMDEAQATVAIDLSNRPYLRWEVELQREYVGDFPTEMLEHFYYTLAMNAKATLHVKADGKNEHHIIESVFKSFARALRFAVSRNERTQGVLPSTKGTI